MSELKQLLIHNTIQLIKKDQDFFSFNEAESLLEKMGFINDHRQAIAIKMGLKIENGITLSIVEYCKLHSISSIEKRPPFIFREKAEKHHKGERQIDFHFYNTISNVIWVDEMKMNPNLDKGKQDSLVDDITTSYSITKEQHPTASILLGYASIPYSSNSQQIAKMKNAQKRLKKLNIDCKLYHVNELMTEVLGLNNSSFSNEDLLGALKEIGLFVKESLSNI